MSNTESIPVIRQCLQQQFPKHFIVDFLEGASRALHYAILEFDFLLDHTGDCLQQVLVSSGLEDNLREAGAAPVTFSKTGFRTESREAIAGLMAERLDPNET